MNIWCAVICGSQRLRNSELLGLVFIFSLDSFLLFAPNLFLCHSGES